MKISVIVMIVFSIAPASLYSMQQEKLMAAVRQGDWHALKGALKAEERKTRFRTADSQDPEMQETIDWQAISAYAAQQYQQAKQIKICSFGTFFYAALGLGFLASSAVLGAYNVGNDVYDLSQGESATTVARIVPSQAVASATTMFTGFKFLYYAFVQRPKRKVQSAALVKATLQQHGPMVSQFGGFVKEVMPTRSTRSKRTGVAAKKGRKQGEAVRPLPADDDDDLDCTCLGPIIDWFARRQ